MVGVADCPVFNPFSDNRFLIHSLYTNTAARMYVYRYCNLYVHRTVIMAYCCRQWIRSHGPKNFVAHAVPVHDGRTLIACFYDLYV